MIEALENIHPLLPGAAGVTALLLRAAGVTTLLLAALIAALGVRRALVYCLHLIAAQSRLGRDDVLREHHVFRRLTSRRCGSSTTTRSSSSAHSRCCGIISLQSDIFDHVLAIGDELGLQVFQEPAGSDLEALVSLSASEA